MKTLFASYQRSSSKANWLARTACVALFATVLAEPLFSEDENARTREITESFPSDVVKTVSGRIVDGVFEVRGEDRDTFAVTITLTLPNTVQDGADAVWEKLVPQISLVEGTLTVTVLPEGDGNIVVMSGRDHYPKVRVEVVGPVNQSGAIRTTTGAIELDSIQGDFDAKSSTGAVSAAAFKGDLSIETTTGSIAVARSSGKLELESSTGPIRVDEHDGPLQFQTSNGATDFRDVRGAVSGRSVTGPVKIALNTGSFDIRTSSGEVQLAIKGTLDEDSEVRTTTGPVTVTLDATMDLNVYGKSVTGTISGDSPLNLAPESDRRRAPMRGMLGDGGAVVKVESTTGAITFRVDP